MRYSLAWEVSVSSVPSGVLARPRTIQGFTAYDSDESEATMTGTIARLQLEKGFGFIKDNAGQDYFFHRSAVVGEGMENLREGDSVEFTVGQGPKGPRAESVRRTST